MKGAKIRKSKNGEVEVEGEIALETVTLRIPRVLARLKESFELPGFRKGNVPDEILRAHFGDKKIFEEAAEYALGDELSSIISEQKLRIIAPPQAFITNLNEGSPVEFRAQFLVIPEFELPDYARIAKNVPAEEAPTVTAEEIDEVLKALIRSRPQEEGKEAGDELSRLTDEFARSVGHFNDAAGLKEQIEKNLLAEKLADQKEKRRAKIVEAVIEKTRIELPERLIDQEIARMNSQFERELSQAGTTLDEYLKNAHKTKEKIYEAWKPAAQRRVKTQLVIEAIAEHEHIVPEKEAVEEETRTMLARYHGLNAEHAKEYVIMALTNELVFRFLEKEEAKGPAEMRDKQKSATAPSEKSY